MGKPHLVLARRYRPQKFCDLVGQEPVVRILHNALRMGRLGHAFLFHGVRGTGKTTLARLLARVVNCTDSAIAETHEPCNQCDSCLAILEDRHIDVVEMDAASHTGVDDVRPLIEAAIYRPQSARYKVYIIDEVHMLSKSAFNALLKTLEEPPPHIKFIFATTEIRRLPATILSRCLRFDLRRVPVDVLVQHFQTILAQETTSIDTDALSLIAHAADGSVRDGLSILDQVITSDKTLITESDVRALLGLSNTQDIIHFMDDIFQGAWSSAQKRLEDFYHAGLDPAQILQECLTLVHHITQRKLNLTLPGRVLYPQDVLDRWAGALSLTWLLRVWQIMLKGLEDLKTALRPEYVLEMTLTLCVLIKDPQGSLQDEVIQGNAPVLAVPASPEPHVQSVNVTSPQDVTPLPQTFTDMVRLFEDHKEMILAFHLKQDVELVSYEPGSAVLYTRPPVPVDFINKVAKHLQSWTGYAWQVTSSKTRGGLSLKEQDQQRDQALFQKHMEQPVPRAVQEAFPDAKVEWSS